ncbi:Protein wos2 [Leucoagaricus sp. SymC.cos]|nr:Protein wos2 [Leucoagaricus sp. SymC.cos]
MTAIHPQILWAQRSSALDEAKNTLYLTVNLPDIHKDTLDYKLTETTLTFKAMAGVDKDHEKEYAFELEFNEGIDPEVNSSPTSLSRAFDLKLRKKVKKEEYWPRLTKDKNRFVKTNFDKWVDEDEQNAKQDDDTDFENMGLGGGMPGELEQVSNTHPFSSTSIDYLYNMPKGGDFGGVGSSTHDDHDHDSSDDEGPPPLEDAEPTA